MKRKRFQLKQMLKLSMTLGLRMRNSLPEYTIQRIYENLIKAGKSLDFQGFSILSRKKQTWIYRQGYGR
ncbi:MAG: hypothetical protein ACP5T9_05610 [Thermoplasmata archaeon]